MSGGGLKWDTNERRQRAQKTVRDLICSDDEFAALKRGRSSRERPSEPTGKPVRDARTGRPISLPKLKFLEGSNT